MAWAWQCSEEEREKKRHEEGKRSGSKQPSYRVGRLTAHQTCPFPLPSSSPTPLLENKRAYSKGLFRDAKSLFTESEYMRA
jgi:hypothetical protein